MAVYLYDKDGTRVQYVTVAEFAERAKCSKATVYDWINQGMPNLRLGPAGAMIPVQAAKDWVAARYFFTS